MVTKSSDRSGIDSQASMFEPLEQRMLMAADLAITSIKYPAGVYNPGQAIKGTITIKNLGDTATPAFDTTITIGPDAIFGNGDTLLRTFNQPALKPHQSRTVRFSNVVIPTGLALGNYNIAARADSGLAVDESNETNNDAGSNTIIGLGTTFNIKTVNKGGGEKGKRPAIFMITRNSNATAQTINLETSGTAINGVDYNTLPATITFPKGKKTMLVKVIPITDSLTEGTETVTLTIGASTDYIVGAQSSATLPIADAP